MQAMSAIALPNGNVGHFRRRPEKFQRILTYMEKVLFAAAFFVAYTIQAVTGFAGNIFAMPVGTHVMGLSSSVAVLNAMGFFACGMLAVLNFKHINWRELAKMTCGMLPFLALGIWLDTVLPLPVLLRIYGAIIVAAAGLIQGMFVSGGAFLVIYAVQKMKDKQQFRATLSALWAILNFLYALLAFTQGHFTGDVVLTVGICIPIAIVTNILGQVIQKRISQEKFLKLTYVLLLLVGLVLLITS